MKRNLWIYSALLLVLFSCIEEFEINKDGEQLPPTIPELTLSQQLLGSYSVRLDCNVEKVDRVFIRGGFRYGTDPELKESHYAPGFIVDNLLSVIASDIEPNSTYYFQAVISDDHGTVESEVASFSSTIFKVPEPTYNFGWQGGKLVVEAQSNLKLKYTVVEGDWIVPAEGENFNIQENTEYSERTGTIRVEVEDGIFMANVTVSQDQSPLHFKSEALKNYLVGEYDSNGSGEIEKAEFDAITSIELVSNEVTSIDEVRHFANLTSLSVRGTVPYGGKLKAVDLSSNTKLEKVDLCFNNLQNINLSSLASLKTLLLDANKIASLDISGSPLLEILTVSKNYLETLDVSGNHSLLEIYCPENRLNALDGLECPSLKVLDCSFNCLKTLDVTGTRAIVDLNFSNNIISNIDLTQCQKLESVDCSFNNLTGLYTRKNTLLKSLSCTNNDINVLDVRYNRNLEDLNCHYNQLKVLDITNNNLLQLLDCSNNDLDMLDIENCKLLSYLRCKSCPLAVLYIGADQKIEGVTVERSEEFIPSTTTLKSHRDLVNIPDSIFKEYLLSRFDTDGDGEISVDEGMNIKSVNICTDNVSSLKGIESFKNLAYLNCSGSSDEFHNTCGQLTELDLRENVNLVQMFCENNRISFLDLSQNIKLRTLWCRYNLLESLDLSQNPDLVDVKIEGNPISEYL